MKRIGRIGLAATLLVVLGVGGRALAESGTWALLRGVTSASSAYSAQSGPYQLQATVGEPILAHAEAGGTAVDAGYWTTAPGLTPPPGGNPGGSSVYLPQITR